MKGAILLVLFGGCAVFFALGFFYLIKYFNQGVKEKGIDEGNLKQVNIWELMKKEENKNIVNFIKMMLLAILTAIVMMYITNTFPDY